MPHYPKVAFLLACTIGLLGCSSTAEQRTAAVQPSNGLFASHTVAAPWGPQTPLGTIVAAQPATARIFELIGIDYCCGGQMPLATAADAKGVNLTRLLSALAAVGPAHAGDYQRDWREASVDELMDHIVNTYHAELRRDLPRLEELIATVTRVHGPEHAELKQVQTTFLALKAEMEEHIELEEQAVFPAIRQLARGQAPDDVESLMLHMMDDHDEAGAALETIHRLTRGYAPPADACALYRQMLQSLERFERQTLSHIHLENNVLVPKARELLSRQTSLTQSPPPGNRPVAPTQQNP